MTQTDASGPSRPAGIGATRPLTGVKVLEFGHVAAGPFAGMLLADLGADVVKVESPQGDDMRGWPPLESDDEGNRFSHNFASLNRGKRSVVANLKDPDELASVRALAGRADVLVENYRPGVLARLGLGFDEVSAGHRGIVYCSISGFGQHSPYRDRGAFDVVIQGMSGLMSVTGPSDGDPVKCGVPMGDFVAGLYAALTVVSALPGVRASGESAHLDCPMLDCLLAVSALQTSEYWGTGRVPRRLGSAHPRNAPYQAFRASDGAFTLAAGNDRLWRTVCETLRRPDLLDDARFRTQLDRAEHQQALEKELQESFRQHTVEHWLEVFGAEGVPCGPIYSFADVLADRHTEATGLLTTMPAPVIGSTPTVAYPVRTEGTTWTTSGPPDLGAHTRSVSEDWGVTR